MILSNRGIQRALDDGRLVIRPEPRPRQPTVAEPNCPYNTTAVDLKLGSTLSIPKKGPFNYDLRQGGIAKFLAENCKHLNLEEVGSYVMQPGQFILGQTLEHIELPIPTQGQPLAARIEGKSSFARCGLLVHFTAPTVHAGFAGTLTLEMKNLGESPVTLYLGEPICQLIVEVVEDLPFENPSQFQGQTTPPGAPRRKI